nr:unnamed protein product [Callosobruchus analis]
MHGVDKVSKFIISCCVLHNVCMLNNDEFENVIEIDSNNIVAETNDIEDVVK